MKFSNTPTEVMKRLGYCTDLNNMLLARTESKRYEGLIKIKRKTLESLVLGKTVKQGEELASSPSSVFDYVSSKLLEVEKLPDFERSQASYDLLSLVELSFLGQKQLDIISSTSDTKKHADLMQRVSDLADIKDKKEFIYLVKKRSKLADIFNLNFINNANEIKEKIDKITNQILEKQESISKISVENENELKSAYKEEATLIDSFRDLSSKKEDSSIEFHKKVMDTLLENSPVTDEDAEKWFSSIKLSSSAKKAFKNSYVLSAFKESALAVYKLTGGRIPSFELFIHDKIKDGRAYARNNLMGLKKSEVHLTTMGIISKPKTTYHELTHLIEYSDLFLNKLGKDYIQSRSLDGGKQHKLKNLMDIKGFSNDEKAYKTDMFSHYAAKIYNQNATEAFTMVVEKLADHEQFTDNYLLDPDTFEFVLGALTLPKTEYLNKTIEVASIVNNKDLSSDDHKYFVFLFNSIIEKYKREEVLDSAVFSDEELKTLGYFANDKRYLITSPMGNKYLLAYSRYVKNDQDSRGKKGYNVFDCNNGLPVSIENEKLLFDETKYFGVQIESSYACIIVIALYEYFYKQNIAKIRSQVIDSYTMDLGIFLKSDILVVAKGLGIK